MSKLLWANWMRLRTGRGFWLALGGVFLGSVLSIWSSSLSVRQMVQSGFVRTLDDCFFGPSTLLGALFAAFLCLFLSAEFADGAVRNKLIVGHSRAGVYLANYLTCLGACLAFVCAWVLGSLPGLLWIGPFSMGAGEFWMYLLVAAGFTAAFTALFALVNLFFGNKAVTVVFSLALWLVLVLAAGALYDRLSEPELTGGVMYADGAFREVDPAPHPMYLAGPARMLCTLALEFLPTGQALLMHGAQITAPWRQLGLSALFTALFLWAGVRFFEKKEIR